MMIKLHVLLATEILYVLPESSVNITNCPSQPCATLNKHLLNNGTLPVTSNVEYYFLPGEHYIPANMVLQNLYNFSIIGNVNRTSSVVLVGYSHLYVINITDSQFVTIANIMFKNYYTSSTYKRLSNLKISCCFSCRIENVTFLHYGIMGNNLIGESYLNNVMIETIQYSQLCCQEILLQYTSCPLWNISTDYMHAMTINQIFIHNFTKCTTSTDISGLHINLEMSSYRVKILIANSNFYYMNQGALQIYDRRAVTNRNFLIVNCTFLLNTASPVISIVMSPINKNMKFIHCNFQRNIDLVTLIKIDFRHREKIFSEIALPTTNISLIRCEFMNNKCELLKTLNANDIFQPNLFFKFLNIVRNS